MGRWLWSFVVMSACAASRPVTEPRPAPAAPLRFGVDTHVHLTMAQGARPLFSGEPGSGVLTWNPRTRLANQLEVSHLRAAGVRLVFGALWPPNATRPGRTALDGMGDEVLRLLDLKSIQWRSALDARVTRSSRRFARRAYKQLKLLMK
jgi:hypothetical protein